MIIDPKTGLLRPNKGVSVESAPDGLERFGGAYEVTSVPPELTVIRRGLRPTHHEIVPVGPMTFDEYADALSRVVLVPVTAQGADDDRTS